LIPPEGGPDRPSDPSTAEPFAPQPDPEIAPAPPAVPRSGSSLTLPPPSPTSAGDPARPGASTFTIEGRSAPALFVVGWLATVLGLGAVLIAVLGGANPAAPILAIGGLLVLSLGLIAAAGAQAVERRARGVAGYTGPSPFLVIVAAFAVSFLIGALVGVPLEALGVDLRSPLSAIVSLVIQAVIYVGLIRLLVVDTGALSWAEMGIRRPDGRVLPELVAGALWAGPVILATVVVAGILAQLLPVTPTSPLPPTGDDIGLVLNLIAGALLAPIAEEILFRGFATTAWARTMGPRRAIVRGALFFAFVHVLSISGADAGEAISLAIVGFASRIPVALVLGWLYLRRGSLWAPIGLHATFNGILIVLGEIALRSGAV
jgi:membrane protease YdiL (CAAX protease family)